MCTAQAHLPGLEETYALQSAMSALGISGHCAASEPCPLYPRKRTSVSRVGRLNCVAMRLITRDYPGLPIENFVCSSTPSATATFDGLR